MVGPITSYYSWLQCVIFFASYLLFISGVARIIIYIFLFYFFGGGILKLGGRSILYVGYNVNIKCVYFKVFVRLVEAD